VDQLIPSLAQLLLPFAAAFRQEPYGTFCSLVAAWIVCLGRRSVSRLWETTGRSRTHNHAAAFRLFSQAVWNWDEISRILLVQLLAIFAPGTRLWLVVDDTLCHKRGAKVAFGGIFLDAVLSSKRHKVFRFGNNWVMLGLIVELPCRRDRFFCLPILWRICDKRGKKAKHEHQTKSQRAAEMITLVAGWYSRYRLLVVADMGYIGKHLLHKRADNVDALGPITWKAALYEPSVNKKGQPKCGQRLPTPKEMLTDDKRWAAVTTKIAFKNERTRELEVKRISDVCWKGVTGVTPVVLVLVRDPQGEWRNEALVCTDVGLTTEEIITGYCRRWSVEVAFCDAKQMLGFHEQQVWCVASVERAAPTSWFLGSLIVLWYASGGVAGPQAARHRPWYQSKVSPTFADMVSALRLQLWEHWLSQERNTSAERDEKLTWLLEYIATAN
jgi:hypothetical protein